MTKLEALIALRDKVKAGEFWSFTQWGEIPSPIFDIGAKANDGSLDAAEALHEAVLPDWSCHELISRGKRCTVTLRKDILGDPYTGVSDNLARAWFLAILEALIAKEKQ